MNRTTEPFWWALFGAGGTLAAFFIPAHIFMLALGMPLGWIQSPSHGNLLALVEHPLTRLYLFALITLTLFHWAHRFRFTLYDGLQLKHLNKLIAVLCYGSAAVGSVFSVYTLWII